MMNRKLIAWLLATIMILAVFATAAIPAAAAGAQKTALTINAPGSVYSLQTFDLSGQLIAGTSGTGIDNMKVTVYRSTDGKKWAVLGTCLTTGGGYYKVSTSESAAGTYYYKASFAGNKVYAAVQSQKVTSIVAVSPVKATGLTLTVSYPTLYKGEMNQIYGYLTDGAGNDIRGKTIIITVADNNGPFRMQEVTTGQMFGSDGLFIWSFDTTDWPSGIYTFQASFAGDNEYASATSNPVQMEVKVITTTLTLTIDPTPLIGFGEFTLSGKLTGPDGKGISGQNIEIQLYDTVTNKWEPEYGTYFTTDGDGVYTYTSWAGDSTGTWQKRAVFAGAGKYAGSMSDPCDLVCVEKPLTATVLTCTIEPNPATYGDTVTMSGTLTANGAGVSGKTIRIQQYDTDTNEWKFLDMDLTTTGDGSFSYTPGEFPGTYQFQAVFEGGDGYAPATSEVRTLVVNTIVTHLSFDVSRNPVTMGDTITMYGKLTDEDGMPLSYMDIFFEYYEDGLWHGFFSINAATTNTMGEYSIDVTDVSWSSRLIRAKYGGITNCYAPAASDPIAMVVNIP